MKKGNFDISAVPNDGFLIFPLSMSRLANAQSGAALYDFLKFFESKVRMISLDVVFLYTNDLYLNSDDRAVEIRKKTLNQMLSHKGEFLNLLLKEKKYVPAAFYFLPWDYAILNSEGFYESKNALVSAKDQNVTFRQALLEDLKSQEREATDANMNFLIEEVVVTHLLVQKKVPLPHTLASSDGWRLILYPGDPIRSLVCMHREDLLTKRTDMSEQHSLFARSFYNMEKRVLIDFDVKENVFV
jgi:hypothetical protein